MTDAEIKKLGIRQLPKNLLQAIEALKKDKLSDEVLGSVMKISIYHIKMMNGNVITKQLLIGK